MASTTPSQSAPPTVAIFTANPSSLTMLDLEGEVRAIASELDTAGLEDMLRFRCRGATTPATVQRAMLMDRPTVVHFSGHGRGRGRATRSHARRSTRDLVPDTGPAEPTGIMLHGDHRGEVRIVSGEALGRLFAHVGSTVRLVVLNACHSAQQMDAIVEHGDFVSGVDGAITDEAARVFSVALYRALAFGRTIKDAFDLGVNALMLEGLEVDKRLPVLRARPSAKPRATTLAPAPPADDGMTWDVFIAYAHADRELVHPLAVELHERHLRVFLDEWELGPADVVSRRLEQGVDGSNHGLVAISPQTMAQPWVQEAYAALLERAVTQGRRLIPVLIGQQSPELPPFLRTRQCVDLREATAPTHRRGIDVIARALRGQRPGPPPRRRS